MILFLIYFKAFGVPALENRAGITEAGLWGTHLGGCVHVSPHWLLRYPGGFELELEELGRILPWQRLSEAFFEEFWRFLEGFGSRGCLRPEWGRSWRAFARNSPCVPALSPGLSPQVRVALGTGHHKSGCHWRCVTLDPTNPGDRSPWV